MRKKFISMNQYNDIVRNYWRSKEANYYGNLSDRKMRRVQKRIDKFFKNIEDGKIVICVDEKWQTRNRRRRPAASSPTEVPSR